MNSQPSRLASIVLAGVSVVLAAAPVNAAAPAATPEEAAVLASVQALFDCMAKRDAAAIKAQWLPGAALVAMRDGKPTPMTADAFAERMGRPAATQIQERIHDPLVRIDNDLAVVWAPFEFLTDGKISSCGTDLFNLVKADGGWKIASLSYTGSKNCQAR